MSASTEQRRVVSGLQIELRHQWDECHHLSSPPQPTTHSRYVLHPFYEASCTSPRLAMTPDAAFSAALRASAPCAACDWAKCALISFARLTWGQRESKQVGVRCG
jgi:hypothetical protein